ncbi:hypothetical protein JL721_1805 [Aureococcus anophagefferens]|nr:hypothetical protein JL721_1805 [Aureococcus anophagefferens]
MHAILALAVGAAAFGSSSSATSSEDLESIEATLDHVEEMTGESLGVLGLGSGDLNLFERAGFVVPFDWECQTGTSGGVYPCPNGIPSTCRANTGGVSSACAKCYCEVGDAVSALYDDGESYSATVTEVTGSDITVTYSDDDTSTYDLTESGAVQTAKRRGLRHDLRLVDARHGGLGQPVVERPYVSQSYINFKVTRYEMADAFGVEFYSTEGYAKVFSTGDVHFKPDNAERTVYINEQVERRETDVDHRLSTAEAVLGDIDLTLPIDHARLVEARYRHSNTRGGSQKPAAASEVPSPKGEPVALKDAPVEKARRRLGRRGGGRIATTGSFSISSGNRSGNG